MSVYNITSLQPYTNRITAPSLAVFNIYTFDIETLQNVNDISFSVTNLRPDNLIVGIEEYRFEPPEISTEFTITPLLTTYDTVAALKTVTEFTTPMDLLTLQFNTTTTSFSNATVDVKFRIKNPYVDDLPDDYFTLNPEESIQYDYQTLRFSIRIYGDNERSSTIYRNVVAESTNTPLPTTLNVIKIRQEDYVLQSVYQNTNYLYPLFLTTVEDTSYQVSNPTHIFDSDISEQYTIQYTTFETYSADFSDNFTFTLDIDVRERNSLLAIYKNNITSPIIRDLSGDLNLDILGTDSLTIFPQFKSADPQFTIIIPNDLSQTLSSVDSTITFSIAPATGYFSIFQSTPGYADFSENIYFTVYTDGSGIRNRTDLESCRIDINTLETNIYIKYFDNIPAQITDISTSITPADAFNLRPYIGDTYAILNVIPLQKYTACINISATITTATAIDTIGIQALFNGIPNPMIRLYANGFINGTFRVGQSILFYADANIGADTFVNNLSSLYPDLSETTTNRAVVQNPAGTLDVIYTQIDQPSLQLYETSVGTIPVTLIASAGLATPTYSLTPLSPVYNGVARVFTVTTTASIIDAYMKRAGDDFTDYTVDHTGKTITLDADVAPGRFQIYVFNPETLTHNSHAELYDISYSRGVNSITTPAASSISVPYISEFYDLAPVAQNGPQQFTISADPFYLTIQGTRVYVKNPGTSSVTITQSEGSPYWEPATKTMSFTFQDPVIVTNLYDLAGPLVSPYNKTVYQQTLDEIQFVPVRQQFTGFIRPNPITFGVTLSDVPLEYLNEEGIAVNFITPGTYNMAFDYKYSESFNNLSQSVVVDLALTTVGKIFIRDFDIDGSSSITFNNGWQLSIEYDYTDTIAPNFYYLPRAPYTWSVPPEYSSIVSTDGISITTLDVSSGFAILVNKTEPNYQVLAEPIYVTVGPATNPIAVTLSISNQRPALNRTVTVSDFPVSLDYEDSVLVVPTARSGITVFDLSFDPTFFTLNSGRLIPRQYTEIPTIITLSCASSPPYYKSGYRAVPVNIVRSDNQIRTWTVNTTVNPLIYNANFTDGSVTVSVTTVNDFSDSDIVWGHDSALLEVTPVELGYGTLHRATFTFKQSIPGGTIIRIETPETTQYQADSQEFQLNVGAGVITLNNLQAIRVASPPNPFGVDGSGFYLATLNDRFVISYNVSPSTAIITPSFPVDVIRFQNLRYIFYNRPNIPGIYADVSFTITASLPNFAPASASVSFRLERAQNPITSSYVGNAITFGYANNLTVPILLNNPARRTNYIYTHSPTTAFTFVGNDISVNTITNGTVPITVSLTQDNNYYASNATLFLTINKGYNLITSNINPIDIPLFYYDLSADYYFDSFAKNSRHPEDRLEFAFSFPVGDVFNITPITPSGYHFDFFHASPGFLIFQITQTGLANFQDGVLNVPLRIGRGINEFLDITFGTTSLISLPSSPPPTSLSNIPYKLYSMLAQDSKDIVIKTIANKNGTYFVDDTNNLKFSVEITSVSNVIINPTDNRLLDSINTTFWTVNNTTRRLIGLDSNKVGDAEYRLTQYLLIYQPTLRDFQQLLYPYGIGIQVGPSPNEVVTIIKNGVDFSSAGFEVDLTFGAASYTLTHRQETDILQNFFANTIVYTFSTPDPSQNIVLTSADNFNDFSASSIYFDVVLRNRRYTPGTYYQPGTRMVPELTITHKRSADVPMNLNIFCAGQYSPNPTIQDIDSASFDIPLYTRRAPNAIILGDLIYKYNTVYQSIPTLAVSQFTDFSYEIVPPAEIDFSGNFLLTREIPTVDHTLVVLQFPPYNYVDASKQVTISFRRQDQYIPYTPEVEEFLVENFQDIPMSAFTPSQFITIFNSSFGTNFTEYNYPIAPISGDQYFQRTAYFMDPLQEVPITPDLNTYSDRSVFLRDITLSGILAFCIESGTVSGDMDATISGYSTLEVIMSAAGLTPLTYITCRAIADDTFEATDISATFELYIRANEVIFYLPGVGSPIEQVVDYEVLGEIGRGSITGLIVRTTRAMGSIVVVSG